MTLTLYKKLTPGNLVPCDESLYVTQKRYATSLILAMVRLEQNFPIIGIPEHLHLSCLSELEELGVSTICSASSSSSCEYRCTAFGEDVISHSVDVHVGVLASVCARLNLPWHGRIAAAYVQTSKDLFLRSNVATTCGLLPEQVALGRSVGFNSQWAHYDDDDDVTSPKSTCKA